tara:strand:- start:399 stop:989 length:591 start_codon:yes stop_codon:yes gene_type:complete
MATLANTGEANQMAFGQHGCAFVDDDDNIFIPPDGKVVVAIQCLGDTEFDLLVSEDPNRFFNTASSAHGIAQDTVSTGVTGGTFIDMDGDVTASVGDSMYLASTGAFIAKVKAVGVDSAGSADASAIELDRVSTVTAAAHIFTNGDQGSGGVTLDTSNVFPKGMTIYGRWTVVSLAADQNSDGAVLYLGPANYHPE